MSVFGSGRKRTVIIFFKTLTCKFFLSLSYRMKLVVVLIFVAIINFAPAAAWSAKSARNANAGVTIRNVLAGGILASGLVSDTLQRLLL